MENGRTRISLDLDLAELPVIAEVLSIGATAEMMCGHHKARRSLEAIQKRVEQHIPAGAKVFEGGVWYEICLALYAGSEWSVEFDKRPWHDKGDVRVTIGEKTWSTDRRHSTEDDVIAVREVLEVMAPLPAYQP